MSFQLADRLGCPYAGHHVFALGVDQVLAVNSLGAGCRVPGKGHAGSGRVAHITEYHGLDINRRTPVAGDVVHAAVYVGPGVIPGTEYGLHRFHQLDVRILGEVLADGFFIQGFEAFDQFFHALKRLISFFMSLTSRSISNLTPFCSLISSIIFSNFDLGTSMTTSENIWMKRR